jgi:aminopeptidase N
VLQLHPDIVNDVFAGVETIEIEITEDYFDNPAANFDVSFNFYPSQTFSTIILYVDGPDDGEYDLAQDLITNDTIQIATAIFNLTQSDVQDYLADDNTFSIYIEYSGAIRGGSDLAGWYKSQYEYNGTTVTNLVTQFQATDARSVFPCFDEPAFKATFDITFIAPVDAVTLSNMEPDGDAEDVDGDCTWTSPQNETKSECVSITFEQTPKMSTYLLAFVIGGYLHVDEADDNEDPKQTVYYPYTFHENRATFALAESIKVLDLFGGSDGFDIDYTDSGIDKLDSIAVNDFAAGAMENWGLVVYRTVRLLVDPEISSQASKSGQILIIAHELAHQWFGNLVSPAWWDDLWLNEGFATYMAYYGGNQIQPEYTLLEKKVQAITKVMVDDSSVFTHAVKQEVAGDPTQILSTFSSITYQKGMGVINTIANVMGNEDFLEGIHDYLEEYKFGTATSAQLGDKLDDEYDDISLLMDSFILQEGFPLIRVDTTVDGDNLIFAINQQRFVKQGPRFYQPGAADDIPFVTQEMVDSFSEQTWRVPMFWRDAEGGLIEIAGTVDGMMLEAELTSTNPRPDFYLVNPIDGDPQKADEGLFNFFRVQYDDFSMQLLMDNWLEVGKLNQFTIISDRFALMQASYITATSYLDFVRNVVDQMLGDLEKGELPEYAIFDVIVASFVYIDDIYCELVFENHTPDDKALRGYFREFASDIIRRVLRLVVDDIKKPFRIDHEDCPSNSDCNILKSVCLKALVRFNDYDTLYAAYELFYACSNRVCDNPELCYGCNEPKIEDGRLAFVQEDVLQALIGGVLAFGANQATLNDIISLYDIVNIEQQTYILSALGAVYEDPHKVLVTKALDFIMSPTVRSNMKVSALVSMKVCTAREPLWSYMSTEDANNNTVFDSLFAGSGLFSQEPLTSLANVFASEAKHDEVKAFFANENRVNAGTEKYVAQTLENVYSRFLWKSDMQPALETYMRTYVVDKFADDMEIWQIVMVTVGCCFALVLLVVAFWAISRPSESDRFVYYMSLKREKREKRKKSSLSHGAGGAGTSLGDTMDRSIRPATLQDTSKQDIVEEKQPTVVTVEKAAKTGYGAMATQDT